MPLQKTSLSIPNLPELTITRSTGLKTQKKISAPASFYLPNIKRLEKSDIGKKSNINECLVLPNSLRNIANVSKASRTVSTEKPKLTRSCNRKNDSKKNSAVQIHASRLNISTKNTTEDLK